MLVFDLYQLKPKTLAMGVQKFYLFLMPFAEFDSAMCKLKYEYYEHDNSKLTIWSRL